MNSIKEYQRKKSYNYIFITFGNIFNNFNLFPRPITKSLVNSTVVLNYFVL